MNSKFYLFRHGLAVEPGHKYNRATKVAAKLLPEGKNDILALAEKIKPLKTDINLCSEFIRCRQTAAIITKITGKTFKLDSRLNEYHQETFLEFTNRVKNFLKDIQSKNYQNILISTHGAVIAAITHLTKGGQFKPEHELDYPPPAGLRIVTTP